MKKSRLAGLTVGLALAAGSVALISPESASAQGTAPCPSANYCFYQNSNFNRTVSGWHLNYNTTPSGNFNNPPSGGGYDRHDQLTSIINNGNRTICIYNNGLFDDTLIKRVLPYADVALLASSVNDTADRWKIFSGSVACPGD
ncbi:peptidase inhibitor family I36 protein [Luteipulveratus mongoliensis]|uniref:Peptidase inhibitor family I36 n=1 Tax=Luteipulveratus mongoliensis TaxID=571913 RepID=A0A0K1JNY5_9MICO|nr:peptidase inhibitor family I36 protein [Luteipulveratus mongoliensis]AKU18280.1 hypothetical protein VV02_24610 [Luteipulveratus mongoliensis]